MLSNSFLSLTCFSREVLLLFIFHTLQDKHASLSIGVQHKFISFAGYLHHKGLAILVADIHKAVGFVLSGYEFIEFGLHQPLTY